MGYGVEAAKVKLEALVVVVDSPVDSVEDSPVDSAFDLFVDLEVAGLVLEGFDEDDSDGMVLPIFLQVLLYASKAASTLLPHKFLICSWTSEESFPQRVGRSAGWL